MRGDHRWLIVLLGNVVFLWVMGQVNHHLTALPLGDSRGPLYLFVGGLPIAFAALRLSLGQALAVSIPTALAMEAGTPIPFGTLMLPAAACVCLAIGFRGAFNRFDRMTVVLAVLLINLVLISALTLVTGAFRLQGPRLALDLLASQLVAVLLSGWYFAAELALLRLFGIDLDTELRDAP